MRALIQRVTKGDVLVDDKIKGQIGCGLVILVGVGQDDIMADAAYLAKKTAALRIFADKQGKMNLSIKDIGGEALVISQFTLYADTSRGNRPGFAAAAHPSTADRLYQEYIEGLEAEQIKVQTGVFQANMLVNIANDGPVTILLESTQKGVVNE